jgi:hypothetical protein
VASWAFLELGCAGPVRDGAGMGIFVARNAMPWGWPALFRLDEIVDRAVEASPLFAAAPILAVRERAARLGARDARFGAFGQLAERLSGVSGWAVMDAAEVSQMGQPGHLRREFIRLSGIFEAGGVDLGEWSGTLRGAAGDETRAARVTGLPTIRAALTQLALGTPGGPWEAAWRPYLEGGAAAPELRNALDEAAQLLADVEAAGLVRVVEGLPGQSGRTRREHVLDLLAIAARHRSGTLLGELLGICAAQGHLEALRVVGSKPFDRVIERGDPVRQIAVFDAAVLDKAMDRLGD